MNDRYQFTVVPEQGYGKCYVWRVSAHGNSTRRRIVTTLYVPEQDCHSPAVLLRALAAELDKPVLQRWTPA